MSLAVPKVSRRRTDQLRNLVRGLELSAINLDASPRIAEQSLCHCFYYTSFSRAGWTQKKQVAHRTPRSVQAREEHLINLGDLFHSLILAYDLAAQGGFKLSSIVAAAVRIEHGCEIRSHKLMVRFAPAVSFLFQAVSLTFCLRLPGSRGPFFAAAHVPKMTEFVIRKPAAPQPREGAPGPHQKKK